MSWYKKILPSIRTQGKKKDVPEGVWTKCTGCHMILSWVELKRNLEVCTKCNHHMRIDVRKRIDQFLDPDNREEFATQLETVDLLKFKDLKKYKDRLSTAQKNTGENEALIAVQGTIHSLPVVVTVFSFQFMGGSMGAVVGERFVQAVNVCLEKKIPLVCFAASGGARMQEALISLLQMAKTSAALSKLSQAGIPFISILTDPTMGGVSASLAMLGDIIIAEPKALIGFAGPRVIEQTVREVLPEGFQRSEFLLEHGAIDMIIDRRDMRNRVASILAKLTRQNLDFCPIRTTNQVAEAV